MVVRGSWTALGLKGKACAVQYASSVVFAGLALWVRNHRGSHDAIADIAIGMLTSEAVGQVCVASAAWNDRRPFAKEFKDDHAAWLPARGLLSLYSLGAMAAFFCAVTYFRLRIAELALHETGSELAMAFGGHLTTIVRTLALVTLMSYGLNRPLSMQLLLTFFAAGPVLACSLAHQAGHRTLALSQAAFVALFPLGALGVRRWMLELANLVSWVLLAAAACEP